MSGATSAAARSDDDNNDAHRSLVQTARLHEHVVEKLGVVVDFERPRLVDHLVNAAAVMLLVLASISLSRLARNNERAHLMMAETACVSMRSTWLASTLPR